MRLQADFQRRLGGVGGDDERFRELQAGDCTGRSEKMTTREATRRC
jgi:hypothetical protein